MFFPLLVLQPSSILTTKTENENAVAFEEGSNLLNVEFGIEGRKKFVLFRLIVDQQGRCWRNCAGESEFGGLPGELRKTTLESVGKRRMESK